MSNPKQMAALVALVAVIAEAAKDVEAAVQPGQTALARLMDLQGLAPKVMALIPEIGDISVAGLAPSDYISLAESLVSDLAISNAHAKAVVDAAFKLVVDVNQYVLPDVQALIAAIKAPVVASA